MYVWDKYSKIKLPAIFTLDIEQLSKVIPALRKIVTKPTDKIIIDTTNVEDITEGAYMVMLAQVEKALIQNKKVGILLSGNRPKKVMEILSTQMKVKHKHALMPMKITSEIIDRAENYNKIDTEIINEIVDELKKIGVGFYPPFYDFLVELVGNRDINWWLWRERDVKTKCFRYVFVDMGIGIIGSYNEAGFLRKCSFKDRRSILKDAWDGKLGSSTRQEGRGRGLPQIREFVEKGYMSDFVLITNGVSLQAKNGTIKISKNPNFVGTYYSWTIDKSNYLKWKAELT